MPLLLLQLVILPIKLLYGRQMHTSLSILPSAPVQPPTDMTVCRRVMQLQNKMKKYTDAKLTARTLCFHEGDKVKVWKPIPKFEKLTASTVPLMLDSLGS